MSKHAAILRPKFEMVDKVLSETLDGAGIANWHKPMGGYFVSLFVMPGTADKVVQMCKDAGVALTPAGATYPYGNDPDDSHIRIAPSFPPLDELTQAVKLFSICARLVAIEKLL